ncbi:MAG: hypothetical protein FJ290_06090 [Planctomycetes bacterium]|nr:hypothetical protein [Planctomycetota bacterium]
MAEVACGGAIRTESIGTVVQVAGPARGKLILSGIADALLGCGLCAFLVSFAASGGLYHTGELSWTTVALDVGLALLGVLLLMAAVRRFRAVGDRRVYLRAGPGGVAVCVPMPTAADLFRLSFRPVSRELAWSETRTWYAYAYLKIGELFFGEPSWLSYANDTRIVFEGVEGWVVWVPTLLLGGSLRRITRGIAEAAARDDLRDADGSAAPAAEPEDGGQGDS